MERGRGKVVSDDYAPTEYHVEWARKMISMLKDGATWIVPDNQTSYIIDKQKRQLQLVEGSIDDWFYKNIILFAKVGYDVVDNRNPLPAELLN